MMSPRGTSPGEQPGHSASAHLGLLALVGGPLCLSQQIIIGLLRTVGRLGACGVHGVRSLWGESLRRVRSKQSKRETEQVL